MGPRRPAATATVACILGMLGGLHWGDGGGRAWPALAIAMALTFLLRRRAMRRWARCGIFIFFGWALAGHAGDRLRASRAELSAAADARQHVILCGEVAGNVRASRASRGETRHRFVLNRLELQREDGSRAVLPQTAVSVMWYGPDAATGSPVPRTGDRWEMSGRLHNARPRRGAGRASDIRHVLISRARSSQQETRPLGGVGAWLERHRRAAAGRLAAGIGDHPEEVQLIQAMLLGYRRAIPRPLNRAFRESGTIHVFAISGLHVVAIAAVLTFVVARLGVPRSLWIVPLAPLLTLYIIGTGAQPSAVRAGLMAILYLLAPLFGRRPDALTTLGVSAFILLGLNPLLLIDLGFVLSYAMVLGLVVMAGPTTRLFHRLLRLDRLKQTVELLNAQGGELARPRWRAQMRYTGYKAFEWTTNLAAVSLASWLVSMPLTSFYFGYFSTYSVVANLFIVPLSTVVMTFACMSLVLTSLWTGLGLACNQVACVATGAMKRVALTATAWPHASVPFETPLVLMLTWYGLLWFLTRLVSRRRVRGAPDGAWLEQVRDKRESL